MTVAATLDTNVAIRVANHILHLCREEAPPFIELAEAVAHEKLVPFVSEASLSFELLSTEDRVVGVLSSLALLPEHRKLSQAEVPPTAVNRVRKYRGAGFGFLRAPRVGLRAFIKLPPDAWVPDERFGITRRRERYDAFVGRFAHMGPERLRELGARLARKRGLASAQTEHLLGRPVSAERLWVDGLIAEVLETAQSERSNHVLGQIRKLFSDWLDLDSVASHYGYGLDFFCTEDKGRGEGAFGIMHPDNRERVRDEFGVEIVSPDKLMKRL